MEGNVCGINGPQIKIPGGPVVFHDWVGRALDKMIVNKDEKPNKKKKTKKKKTKKKK